MIHDHSRFKVVTEFQHLYEHNLSEFAYTHPALPNTVGDAEAALNYALNVLHPRIQPSVDDVTQLPVGGNVVNDQRIVQAGRDAILSAGINSDLANGVLELTAPTTAIVSDTVRLGNVSIDKTAGFPDGLLYVGAVTIAPDTVTLYEDISLTILADLSGLGLTDGLVTNLAFDSISTNNAEMWTWTQFDGQAGLQWNKTADIDWGINSVVQALQDQTQYLYVRKFGITDYDPITELPLAGDFAGQHIYGGEAVNQHLTLHANNGDADATPFNTGFIQFDDSIRPTRNWDALDPDLNPNPINLGEATRRFDTGFFRLLNIGTASLLMTADADDAFIYSTSSNNIVYFGSDDAGADTTNTRTFGDSRANNLHATTSLVSGFGAADATTLAAGSLTTADNSGFDFGTDALVTDAKITGNELDITNGTQTFNVIPNSAGNFTEFDTNAANGFDFGSNNILTTGTLTIGALTADSLAVDNIFIDNNIITTILNTDLELSAHGTGEINIRKNVSLDVYDITGLLQAEITAGRYSTLPDAGGNNESLNLHENTITSTADINFAGGNLLLDADRNIGSLAGGKVSRLYMAAAGSIRVDDGALPAGSRIDVSTLLSFRNSITRRADAADTITNGAPVANDIIKWSVTEGWIASNPDTEIDHAELNNLVPAGTNNDSGHTQFALLGGRTGGQILRGGLLTGTTLALYDNDTDQRGIVIQNGGANPHANGALNLGRSGARYSDIYMNGQVYGLTAEAVADNAAMNALADREGRIAFKQDDDFIYVNDGADWNKVGHNTFKVTKNESVTNGVGILGNLGFDVSAVVAGMVSNINDPRETIWQITDDSNGEVMGLKIRATATHVFVEAELLAGGVSPLPAGNYTLRGIEI